MHIMLPDLQTGHVNVTESSTFRSASSHEIQCKVAIPVEAHVTRDLVLAANAKQDEEDQSTGLIKDNR